MAQGLYLSLALQVVYVVMILKVRKHAGPSDMPAG